MGLLEAIKKPRQLTMQNWRYRLMHWTFYQGNIKHPRESPFPDFLYTHYCPLFHFTNLLVCFLPLTLLVHSITGTCWLLFKIISGLIVLIIGMGNLYLAFIGRIDHIIKPLGLGSRFWALIKPFRFIANKAIDIPLTAMEKLDLISEKWAHYESYIPQDQKKEKFKRDQVILCTWVQREFHEDKQSFMSGAFKKEGYKKFIDHLELMDTKLESLGKKKAEDLIVRIVEKLAASHQTYLEREKKKKDRVVAAINISQKFFKGVLSILYYVSQAALLVTAAGLAYLGIHYTIIGINWLIGNAPWYQVGFWIGVSILSIGAVISVYGLGRCLWKIFVKSSLSNVVVSVAHSIASYKPNPSPRVKKAAKNSFLLVMYPLFVIWWCMGYVGIFIRDVCYFIGDFTSMFYEDNCPPIQIITKDDPNA